MKTIKPTWAYLLLPMILVSIHLLWGHLRTANATQGVVPLIDSGGRADDEQQAPDNGGAAMGDDDDDSNHHRRHGRIVVTKATIPTNHSERFRFTSSYQGSFSLHHGNSHYSRPLQPGRYSVTENDPPDGWTRSFASCSDNRDSGAIDLSAGETVLCTFTSTNLPLLKLEKTATPELIDAGEEVTYDYSVKATIPVLQLVDVSVTDDKCGPVAPSHIDQINTGDQDRDTTLDDNETWHFTCTMPIYKDTVNIATATAKLERLGLPAEDADTAKVDVRPAIRVELSASRASVPERGADVTLTILVTNISEEEALVEALEDSVYGSLDRRGTCSLPQVLAVNGQTYSCSVTQFIGGAPGWSAQQNLVTATARDEENNRTTAQDDVTVTLANATPQIVATKRDLLYIDADGDDAVSVGDTLIYIISVGNASNAAAIDVTLTDEPDPRLILQNGSVQTSQGVVVAGNRAGDREVVIEVGSLAPGATADAGFLATVSESGPGIILNQAAVRFGNANDATQSPALVLSDDPDTPVFGDPTGTPVKQTSPGAGGNLLYLPFVGK